jgi:tight adherence protein B
MTQLLGLPTAPVVFLGLGVAALGVLAYLLFSPGPTRLALSRRRPGTPPAPSLLTRATNAATTAIDKFLRKRGNTASTATALELAGIKMRVQDFVLILCGATLGFGAVGVLLSGSPLGGLLALVVPILVKIILSARTGRRQKAFANQLDDGLQMMASNLRAGHGLLQALDAVARDAPQPLSEEFARVVNETRVGRDLGQALEETAARMGSKDMIWIAQAIQISRQVGGNLAEVLDQVGHTIRERGQIRRQVSTLSAEGRLSAVILILLPFGVAGFIMVTNPGYLMKFTHSLIGYGLLGAAVVLLVLGGVWLRKVTTLKF